MRTRFLVLAVLLVPASTLAGCGDDGGDSTDASSPLEGTLQVFAAASLTDAFEEIAAAFEDVNPDVDVELNLAASSALAAQIQEGAPADIFAAADETTMQEVVDAGEITVVPRVFARNVLEIAVPAGNPGEVEGLTDFADDDLLMGLCAEEVPCGRFAREALDQAGVIPSLDTEEPDVRSLLTKVEAGDLDAGIVYRTDVLAAGDEVEGIVIPESDNVVANYPIAPTANAADAEPAQAFVAFVLTTEGQAILADHGFQAPP